MDCTFPILRCPDTKHLRRHHLEQIVSVQRDISHLPSALPPTLAKLSLSGLTVTILLLAWQTVRRGIGLEINPISDISDVRAKDREAVIRNISYQVLRMPSH